MPAGTVSPFRIKRIILLSTVGGAVFVAGLLNGFPHHGMAQFFLREMAESSGIGLFAKEARFDPPLSLSYSNIALVTPSPQGPLSWNIDRASARLDLISLVGTKPRFNFQINAYGGKFRGRLRHLSKTENHLKGKTVRAVDLKRTRLLFHQDIAGSMDLKTDYTWQTGNETAGHGTISTTIAHLVLKSLAINGFPLPPIIFDTVTSQVFLSRGRGRVEKLLAKGPMADIDGTGTFLLATPYPSTILHLKLLVHLKGALNILPIPNLSDGTVSHKALTLTLDGPVSNLNIAMNGLQLPH